MTYHSDQIQSMISELDRILHQTGRWKLWTLFRQVSQQHKMLERVRNFLVMQQRPNIPTTPTTAQAPSLMRPLPPPHLHPESIKLELTALNAQRDALREEVKFLEQRKALYLHEQALNESEIRHKNESNSVNSVLDAHHLEQIKALRDRTDFLLSSMDSSLQLALTAMQQNVDVYQTSLHQGLDRMHNLGYQGEVLFSALVNHLAQQMGRELAASPTPALTNTSALPIEAVSSDVLQQIIQPSSSILPDSTTAVSLTSETPFYDREITVENIFGDSSDNSFNDVLSPSFSSSLNQSIANTRDNLPETLSLADITLEEMNALFS